MTNEITEKIRETRHRLASKFDNDLDRIVDDLQRQQRESGYVYLDRSRELISTPEAGGEDEDGSASTKLS